MGTDLVTTNEIIEAEVITDNLPAVKSNKTTKKAKTDGVDIRVNADGSKTFYIRYYKNGKLVREKVGRDTDDGINRQYCVKLRATKTSLDRLGELAPAEIKKSKLENRRTFDEAAQEYLQSISDLSDHKTTVGRYNNHLKHVFGSLTLEEITPELIESFKQKKLKAVSQRTGRPYSPKSINDWLNLINVIFNTAIEAYRLKMISPAKAVKRTGRGIGVKREDVDNQRQRYLDMDEIAMLYDAIRTRTSSYTGSGSSVKESITFELELFTRLSLCTGARITSVLNIKKTDINLSVGNVKIKDFKNKSTYTGFLSDSAKKMLEPYMKNLKATDYIIGGKSKARNRSNINILLQPILNELFNEGLAPEDSQNRVVIHTFRHTFGSLLAINETPIFTIKKLMNHKSIEMTMRYAKLAPDQGKDHVRGLGL